MSIICDGKLPSKGWNPAFVRAIELLFSEDENSKNDLRKLYEDAVARNKATGNVKVLKKSESSQSSKLDEFKHKLKTSSSREPHSDRSLKKDMKASGSLDLSGKRSEASSSAAPDKKKPKFTNIDMFAGLTLTKTQHSKKLKKQVSSTHSSSSSKLSSLVTGDDDDDEDDDDMPLAVIETIDGEEKDNVCEVCRLSDYSTSGNQLLECNECHLYFHQRCHKTTVPDKDVRDPRVIWNCYKCERLLVRNEKGKDPTWTLDAASETSSKDNGSKSSSALMKSSSLGNIQKLSGPTKSLLGSSSRSPSTSNFTNRPFSTASSSSMEKRLTEMKKKANNKQLDKRKLPAI